jgi:hypothetical protein
MWVFGWDFFIAGEAVSRLTRHVRENRGLSGHTHFPDFLNRKLVDFFILSLISLPYILPNLLNGVQTYKTVAKTDQHT